MKNNSQSKILLAVVDEQTLHLLKKRLMLWGRGQDDLLYCEEIEEALKLTELHKPSLIVLEDGCCCCGQALEAIEKLREIHRGVEIIALVWDESDEDVEEMIPLRGVQVIIRDSGGYKPKKLYKAIENALCSFVL